MFWIYLRCSTWISTIDFLLISRCNRLNNKTHLLYLLVKHGQTNQSQANQTALKKRSLPVHLIEGLTLLEPWPAGLHRHGFNGFPNQRSGTQECISCWFIIRIFRWWKRDLNLNFIATLSQFLEPNKPLYYDELFWHLPFWDHWLPLMTC